MDQEEKNKNTTPILSVQEEGNKQVGEEEVMVEFNRNLLESVFCEEDSIGKVRHKSIEAVKEEYKKKNWLSRTFSPLTPGSIRGSILSLSGLLLGVGVLALPKVASDSGIIVGVCFLILSGILAYQSLIVMMESSFITKETKYTVITEKLLGKNYRIVLQIVIISLCYGASVNYYLTLQRFSSSFIHSIFDIQNIKQNSLMERAIHILLSTLIIFPASLPRNLNILHNFIALGIFSVLYLIVVVCIQTPSYFQKNFESIYTINWVKIDLRIFPGFCVCCFSYCCQFIVFPVIQELKSPIERRIKKIFFRSISINLSLYLISMFTGFLSFPQAAPDLITDRLPLNPGDNDIIMNIGRIFMVIHIFTSAPLLFIPCKNHIFSLTLFKDSHQNKFVYGLVTFALVYSSAAIAIVFPKIYDALGLLGGTCCVFLTIFLPGLLYLEIHKHEKKPFKHTIIYIGTYLLTLIGIFAAVLSFLRGINVIDF